MKIVTILLWLLIVGVANAAPINLGFEAGDLSGWIQTAFPDSANAIGPFATDSILPPSPPFPAPLGDFQLWYQNDSTFDADFFNMNQSWLQNADMTLVLLYRAAFQITANPGGTFTRLQFRLRKNPGDPFFEETLFDISHIGLGGSGFTAIDDGGDFIRVEAPLRSGFLYQLEIETSMVGAAAGTAIFLAMDAELVPEPSSLAIACSCLIGLLAFGCRRRVR